MAYNRKQGVRPSGRITDLLIDSKKTVLATALVLVMAVMWIRVLIGHKPGAAGAATTAPEATAATQKGPAQVKVRMIELPKIPGRNDAIARDCFNAQEWAPARQAAMASGTGTGSEVPVVSPIVMKRWYGRSRRR